jgi:hypothetical protein
MQPAQTHSLLCVIIGPDTDLTTSSRMFYQQRVDKKRQAEVAKRNRERLRDPSFFPSVPKGLP